MRQSPRWLRTVHRLHSGLTITVLITFVIMNLTGVIDAGTAVRLFLAIELPLVLVFAVTTILRFKRVRRTTKEAAGTRFLDRLETEEPLLRPVVTELRAFQALVLAIAKKRDVPTGAVPVGYTKGTMSFAVVFVVLSIIELAVVHILLPWRWLQIVLLILTVWGVLFVFGFFALRIVHPHFISTDGLHLRWGHKTVLTTPLTNVAAAARQMSHVHTQPQIDGERLVLTQFQSTNVRIRFVEPVAAAAPGSHKSQPDDYHVSEALLFVDDPSAFLQALARLSEKVPA